MFIVLLALAALALGGLALPPQHSSSEGSPSSRSYSSGYTGNTYDTSSNQLSGKTGSSYNSNDGYGRLQVGYGPNWGQDRFHPTTYEEDSHKGEVVLPPLDTDSNPSASQDTVVFAGTGQSNPLQSGSFAQTSDSFNIPSDTVASTSAPSSLYEVPSPPSSYDYRPPPPLPPTPYNYPPPPNFYLPVDPSPPPPPPPPPPKESLIESTFYQIGPKIWFIPLWFSIYFVIYVTALLLKTVIKHKLFIPQTQFQYLTTAPAVRSYQMDELTSRITQGLAKAALRYLRRRL